MDAPPPPPRFKSLEDLDADTQHLILSHIPCGADRGRISLVCRAWRGVVRRHQAQPPLPWLLLPTAFPDGSTRLACAICGSRVHHYITVAPPGARCFGSHDGAWLLLHYRDREPRGIHAINVRTGHVERLPIDVQSRYRIGLCVDGVAILAAALSASPDDASYIGAAVVLVPLLRQALNSPRRCLVALWRKGWATAHEQTTPAPRADDVALTIQDVVYHNGAFHMLTEGNNIQVCNPTIHPDGSLSTKWKTRRFRFEGVDIDNRFVRARYLVRSRGELLLVLRFAPGRNQPTSMFKVFRDADANADASAWNDLDTLGGRILFVGHGCSRSYEVGQHPGFKDGIYFWDAQVMFGDGNVRWYPCSDNGKWSEGRVQSCFPMPHPSDHSAPAWLLP